VLAYELRETLGRIVRRLRAEPGPSASQMIVLGILDRGGPMSVSDLAVTERMRPQSMSQTVHDLETAGLVSRHQDPRDGRRSYIQPTTAGLDTLRTMRAQRETWLTGALNRELSAEERKRLSQALPLLARLADA
jgi:DNA-binding MarR family transcriptional regulator